MYEVILKVKKDLAALKIIANKGLSQKILFSTELVMSGLKYNISMFTLSTTDTTWLERIQIEAVWACLRDTPAKNSPIEHSDL